MLTGKGTVANDNGFWSRGRSGFEVYTGKGTVANDNGVGVGGEVVLRCSQVRVQLQMIMVLE